MFCDICFVSLLDLVKAAAHCGAWANHLMLIHSGVGT